MISHIINIDFEICNKYKYGGLIRPEFEVDVNNMIILKLGDPDSCHIQMNGWWCWNFNPMFANK